MSTGSPTPSPLSSRLEPLAAVGLVQTVVDPECTPFGVALTELTRPVDPPWTAAALFAHMAFWDRFVHARWLLAARTGSHTPLHFDDALLELINDASLQQWAVIPPRIAVQDCLTAAAEIDALIGSLEADVVSEVVKARRERLVDRSLHRGEHLTTIETAFPSP